MQSHETDQDSLIVFNEFPGQMELLQDRDDSSPENSPDPSSGGDVGAESPFHLA